MGMTEDFEASLQVLRGFDTDISVEVNEIKVQSHSFLLKTFKLCYYHFTLGNSPM